MARYLLRIRVNRFLAILGVVALAAGASRYFELRLPIFGILIVLLGVSAMMGPLFRR